MLLSAKCIKELCIIPKIPLVKLMTIFNHDNFPKKSMCELLGITYCVNGKPLKRRKVKCADLLWV